MSSLGWDDGDEQLHEFLREMENDGYVSQNMLHLLREARCAERVIDLITDPLWVGKQTDIYGAGRIGYDVEICASMLQTSRNGIGEGDVNSGLQFCSALENVCYSACLAMRGCSASNTR